MKLTSRIAIVVALIAIAFVPAQAGKMDDQEHESRVLSNEFVVTLGSYLADFDTTVSVGTSSLVGTIIFLEEDLNLDEDLTSFRLDGFWRFKPRHALEFGLLRFERDATTILDKEIEFEGITYEVGANVMSEFDSSLLRLGYRYSFLNNGKVDTGIVGGLSFYDYHVAVEGDATVDDGMGGTMIVFDREEEDLVVPIPTIGLYSHFAITPKTIFRGEAQFLDLEVGDWDGKVIDTRFTVDWYFSKRVGIGGGFAGTDVDVKNIERDTPFSAAYEYSGMILYLAIVAW